MYCDRCGVQARAEARFCPGCGADLADQRAAADSVVENTVQSVGSVLGNRYRIEQEIGRGGMGIVYQAQDQELDMPVALKVLHPRIADRPEAVKQLREEALAAIRLTHPNLVRLHNFENTPQAKYLLMEYVPGQSLAKMLSNGLAAGFTERDVVRIAQQMCEGLAAAHKAGIIHRDIKPSNILITPEGRVKILDFGIARAQTPGTGSGGAGGSAGTPMYMAPEQFRGEKVDGRTDIYSLGATLYEILATHPPFVGENLKRQHLEDHPEPIPGVSDWLNEIVMRCLSKDARQRWPSAEALRKALEGSQEAGAEVRAIRQTDTEPEWRRVARERERAEHMRKAARAAQEAQASDPAADAAAEPEAVAVGGGTPPRVVRPQRKGALPPAGPVTPFSAESLPGIVRAPELTPSVAPAANVARRTGTRRTAPRRQRPPQGPSGAIRFRIPEGILQFSLGAAVIATLAVLGVEYFARTGSGGSGLRLLAQVVLASGIGLFWGLAEVESRNILLFTGVGVVTGLLVGLLYVVQAIGPDTSVFLRFGVEAVRAVVFGAALGAVLGSARGAPAAIGLGAALAVVGGLLAATVQLFIRLVSGYPSALMDTIGGTAMLAVAMTMGAAIGAGAVETRKKMRL